MYVRSYWQDFLPESDALYIWDSDIVRSFTSLIRMCMGLSTSVHRAVLSLTSTPPTKQQVVYGKEGHNAKLAAAFYCVPVDEDDDTPGMWVCVCSLCLYGFIGRI
jgi:hypothetical protein